MAAQLILIGMFAALTQPPAQADPAVADKTATPKKICKTEPPKAGSRLGATRFCGTEEQWRARDETTNDMRTRIEAMQACGRCL
jgi:hypothetical protein